MQEISSTNQSKQKIVITGGLGFIFSHVTEYFVKLGWKVIVIDDKSKGSHPEIIDKSFKLHILDCGSPVAQELIIEENPDYIIHAAAISDVDQSIKEPEYVMRQNIQGSINVFEAARFCPNLKKLLYVSTDEVYGECETKKTESDIIFPKNPYATSKATGSLIRLAYDNTYHTLKDKTCEIRMCNIFGDRQDTRKIFPLIRDSILNGTTIPIQNGGQGYREYLYVKNVPPIVHKILLNGNRTYNITNNDGFTVNELIKKCEEVTGKKVKTTESFRPGMDMKYQMDNSRIKEEFDWKPEYSFEESIKNYLC